MLPEHDVYVTDWRDARVVPLVCGGFDLDDFIDYIVDFIRIIGPDTHVIAVCQPSVPVLAAVDALAAAADPLQPAPRTLLGGQIDPRRKPTVGNARAGYRPRACSATRGLPPVPPPQAG